MGSELAKRPPEATKNNTDVKSLFLAICRVRNTETRESFDDMTLNHTKLIPKNFLDVLDDFFSMPVPGPSKRPRAGGSSLATVAASSTEEKLVLNSDSDKPDGTFGAY